MISEEENLDLKLIYSTHDLPSAELLKGALESEGINCILKPGIGHWVQYWEMLTGRQAWFKIWVAADDYEKALDIKEQILGETKDD